MLSSLRCVLVLSAAVLGPTACAFDPGGLAGWVIVVDPEATVVERYAAEELRDHIALCGAGTLPIVDAVGRSAGQLFVGDSRALRDSAIGFPVVGYSEEQHRVRVGDDAVAIAGGGPRGTLYGVYGFLEDALGVRFLTAGHTHAPAVAERDVVDNYDRTFRPAFDFRWSFYRETNVDPVFAARIRVNTVGTGCSESVPSDPKLGGKSRIRLVNHSFFEQAPSSELAEAHPDWFCVRGGEPWLSDPGDQRPEHRQNQPCMSREGLVQRVADRAIEELRATADYDTVSVAQNDNDNFCECPRCATTHRVEGTPSGALIRFVNRVADRVAAEFPDREVGTLAYQYSRHPPKTTRPRPNVRVQLCSIECCPLHAIDDPTCPANAAFMRDLAGWAERTDRLSIWHYTANFSDYTLPYPDLPRVDRVLRVFADHGVDAVFMQAAGETTGAALADMKNYVVARLLWDPEQDSMDLAEEFVRLHYGPAAPFVADVVPLLTSPDPPAGQHARCFGRARQFSLDDPARSAAALAAIKRALDLDLEESIRRRVELVAIPVHRLALEPAFVAAADRHELPIEERARLRPIAETYVRLCERHRLSVIASNGRRFDWLLSRLESVLGPL